MKKKLTPPLLVFLVVSGAYLWGLFAPFDRHAMDRAFEIARRDASGMVVLIEIDDGTPDRLGVWPRIRAHHARLLDRLFEAEAFAVAFDLDLSARAVAVQDRALAGAIERAGRKVILPVYGRGIRNGSGRPADTLVEPLGAFARHARLAHADVPVDRDGRVRRYAPVSDRGSRPIPSLATSLAADPDTSRPEFNIDFGIRPETIPRISFVDAYRGDFDPNLVARKVVIIGATAPDLGDRFATPVHGAMPSPVVHALAYESIAQGRTVRRAGPWATLIVGLMTAAFLGGCLPSVSLRAGAIAAGALASGSYLAAAGTLWLLPVWVDPTAWAVIAVLAYTTHLVFEVNRRTALLATHRLAGARRRGMLEGLFSDSTDGIVIVNEAGIVQLFNPMASRLLGIFPEGAVGRPIDAVAPELGQFLSGRTVAHAHGRSETLAGACTAHELRIKRGDGKVFPAELAITETRYARRGRGLRSRGSGRPIYVLSFRDITGRKRVERAERRALEQAIAASRAKSEFLANVSHELRTPLNAIIGFSEIITGEMFGPVDVPQYKGYVADIHASGLHLLEVINDILDMSKIEAGEMTVQESEVDVAGIVRSSTRLIRERARAAGLAVNTMLPDDLPCLRADQRMLKQILLNLLSNAVKFTPAGGSIDVRFGRAADGGAFFAVADTGIGIAREDMDRALAPFGQVETGLQRKYEGTGLGLPLVKSMTEIHGGRIEVESEAGRGTTVTVVFGPERVIAPGRRDGKEVEAADAPPAEPKAATA